MKNDLAKILIDETALQQRVDELAAQITADFSGKFPVFICILKGGIIFLADLIKKIDLPMQLDFLSLSSYGDSTKSSGIVRIKKDIDADIQNRHIIIVEDIVDSGLTLKYIKDYFKQHNPASISICTLLDKPDAHQAEIEVDYIGFEVGNEFVVGYGLDYAQKYRNLPYIAILKEEIYR